MQFRRSGQRDQRRRKVFRDEASPEAENSPTPTNKTGKSDAIAKAYSKAAVEETETRVADLIPTRPLGVCVLFLLGLTAIAGVQALHTFVADWSPVLGDSAASTFDVAARGSLNGWLSSLLLGIAAVLSTLIYVIRRHKMDDYGGRYRMWLWTAAGLTLLSINTIAGLHRAFDGLVVFLAGKTLLEFVPGWSLLLTWQRRYWSFFARCQQKQCSSTWPRHWRSPWGISCFRYRLWFTPDVYCWKHVG